MSPIAVRCADITKIAADAIVNAANERMLGGGGVDGAIHAAAGPQLLEACKRLPTVSAGVRCPTGEARITPGFALPARYVIHTVGPIWKGGSDGERDLLAACYRNCLALAGEHSLGCIAFPAISCGVYGYPVAEACSVAVETISRALDADTSLTQVILVAFDAQMAERLAERVARIA